MALLYKYDKYTNEYIGSLPAYPDPLESVIQGKEILAIPPECVFISPPEVLENEVQVFNEELNNWEVKKDFRGLTGFNKKTADPIIIKEIGDLPEDFVLEKPVFLQELKEEKLKELDISYKKEFDKEVEFKGLKISRGEKASIAEFLSCMGSLNYITFDNRNTPVSFSKEEAEKLLKYCNVRFLLLPIKKSELAKSIRGCKSKKQLDKLDLSFDMEGKIEELTNFSIEEINKYVEEHTKCQM